MIVDIDACESVIIKRVSVNFIGNAFADLISISSINSILISLFKTYDTPPGHILFSKYTINLIGDHDINYVLVVTKSN